MLVPSPKLALFLAATLALTLTPGPAVLFIIARSMGQGRRAGLLSVAGIGLGNAVHAAAAALGLAALLASSPLAFSAVKYLGAGYLVLLGLRRMISAGGSALSPEAAPEAGDRGVLGQAFVVAVLNPKTALFFLAFLPQFADPARGALGGQILALGAVFVLVAILTDCAYALLASGLGSWLRRNPAFAQGERYLSGAVYIGLGALSAIAGGHAGGAET
jgi:threonine/homoserine/homoserine lactone efflux protein